MSDGDEVFAGSVPKIYETYLVPLFLSPTPPTWTIGSARETFLACSKWQAHPRSSQQDQDGGCFQGGAIEPHHQLQFFRAILRRIGA